MITIVIAIIKNKLLSFINFFKSNFQLIAVTIIMMLTAFLFLQHKRIDALLNNLNRTKDNYEYYVSMFANQRDSCKVLRLSLDEYKETNDSLINKIKDVLKKLKIKDKELKQALLQKLEIIHDTTVVVKTKDFKLEIKPNSLTSILINKKDSLLTHELSIKNALTVFITNKRVYRNKYKNWFVRLFHFDFKKKDNIEFQIHNSNDLILIIDSRMIELSK